MLLLEDLLPPEQCEPYWTFFGDEHEGFPPQTTYVVFEYYCENLTCSCQRLVCDVMEVGKNNRHIEKSLAIIEYDWSSPGTKCLPKLTEESPQTALARSILEVYKKFIHSKGYLERIKNHYRQIKKLATTSQALSSAKKSQSVKGVGRNDPCPCESGKKYKKCCGLDD